MNNFYVYFLLNPFNYSLPFYVGKGKGKRYKQHFSKYSLKYNSHKNNLIKLIKNKTGKYPDIEFCCLNLTEEEAFKLEEDYISYFGRVDQFSWGILTNKTNGGEGGSGIKKSSELINKIKYNLKIFSRPGELNGMFGKTHTEESKINMSKTRKKNYKKRFHWNNGKKSIMAEYPPDNTWKKGRLKNHISGLKQFK